jgi:hypothetical protein
VNHPRELPITEAMLNDPRARELVRVWATQGRQELILAGKVWDDPAAWGLLLVDLARHVANCYAAQTEMSASAALARLKERFDAEWETVRLGLMHSDPTS